jgi:hypothetical protein
MIQRIARWPTPWSWLPPRLVECKRCGRVVLTRESSPRCSVCGAREDE